MANFEDRDEERNQNLKRGTTLIIDDAVDCPFDPAELTKTTQASQQGEKQSGWLQFKVEKGKRTRASFILFHFFAK